RPPAKRRDRRVSRPASISRAAARPEKIETCTAHRKAADLTVFPPLGIIHHRDAEEQRKLKGLYSIACTPLKPISDIFLLCASVYLLLKLFLDQLLLAGAGRE